MGKDPWISTDGRLFLQLAQNTIAGTLGVPLRIFQSDALNIVAAGLRSCSTRNNDAEHRFRDEVLNSLDYKHGLLGLHNSLKCHQSDLAAWNIYANTPKTVVIPSTDVKQLWHQHSANWIWRTQQSNPMPFQRYLLDYPRLRQLCYLHNLKLLSKLQANNTENVCPYGLCEKLVEIPQGKLLVGPIWIQKIDVSAKISDVNSLHQRIKNHIESLQNIEPSLENEKSFLIGIARITPALTPNHLKYSAEIAVKVFQRLHDIIETQNFVEHKSNLHASEWIRLVQFILLCEQEYELLNNFLTRNSNKLIYRPLSKEAKNRPYVTVRITSGGLVYTIIDHDIHTGVRFRDLDSFELKKRAREFYDRSERNRLFSEQMRVNYLHRHLQRLLFKDPVARADVILHRLGALLDADYVAQFDYDANNEKLQFLALAPSLQSGTKDSLAQDLPLLRVKDLQAWISSPNCPLNEGLPTKDRPIVCWDISKDKAISLVPKTRIRSMIATSLRHMGRFMGVVVAFGLRSRQFRYRATDSMLRAASIISPYIFRGNLYQGLAELQQPLQDYDSGGFAHSIHNERCATLGRMLGCSGVSLWMPSIAENTWYLAGDWGQRVNVKLVGTVDARNFLPKGVERKTIDSWEKDGKAGPFRPASEVDKVRPLEIGRWRVVNSLYLAVPDPTRSNTVLGLLLIHDPNFNQQVPSAYKDLLNFVTGALGAGLQVTEAAILERRMFINYVGHDLRRYLIEQPRIEQRLRERIRALTKAMDSRELEPAEQLEDIRNLRFNIDLALDDLKNHHSRIWQLIDAVTSPQIATKVGRDLDPLIKAYVKEFFTKPPESSCNLYAILNELIQNQKQRGKSIDIELGELRLPEVYLHPKHFEHVLGNLLDNAIQHSIGPQTPIVSWRVQSARIEIKVKNVGGPIRDDERKRIFEWHYRGRASKLKPENERLGLQGGEGLYIARSLARLWGGDVTLSESKQQAPGITYWHTFRIVIPTWVTTTDPYSDRN